MEIQFVNKNVINLPQMMYIVGLFIAMQSVTKCIISQKTYLLIYAPFEDLDPCSMIRVFSVLLSNGHFGCPLMPIDDSDEIAGMRDL